MVTNSNYKKNAEKMKLGDKEKSFIKDQFKKGVPMDLGNRKTKDKKRGRA